MLSRRPAFPRLSELIKLHTLVITFVLSTFGSVVGLQWFLDYYQTHLPLNTYISSISLENLTPEEAEKLVELSRQLNPNVLLEASGGMDLDHVRSFAEAGVDLISVGRLTHSAKAVDISFKIQAA